MKVDGQRLQSARLGSDGYRVRPCPELARLGYVGIGLIGVTLLVRIVVGLGVGRGLTSGGLYPGFVPRGLVRRRYFGLGTRSHALYRCEKQRQNGYQRHK